MHRNASAYTVFLLSLPARMTALNAIPAKNPCCVDIN